MIRSVDLEAELAELGSPLEEALLSTLASGQYVLGPQVEAFEREFAELCRSRHAVGCASGTDALVLALKALGVGPGDQVVTTPFTFFATAAAIAWIGAVPRLADVDSRTGLLEPDAAAAALEGRTVALLPVHLYGQMADVRRFRELAEERGLALVEDAAQSHGATRDGVACGELADAATFSFYPTKNLGCAGEGGLVTTQRADLARALRRLRDQGSEAKYVHTTVGTNSRLHALQAAILRVKLPRLADWNRRRREAAGRYDEALGALEGVQPLERAPGAEHVYHQYAVRTRGERARARILEALRERGIQAAVHYPTPVHLQEAARGWGYGPGDFPAAEALAREVLCLPVHPWLSPADQQEVVAALEAGVG